MFTRIMAVVLAVILLTTVSLSAVWWITLRDQQVNARLDSLISRAEDIAWLAANQSSSVWDTFYGNVASRLLDLKVQQPSGLGRKESEAAK